MINLFSKLLVLLILNLNNNIHSNNQDNVNNNINNSISISEKIQHFKHVCRILFGSTMNVGIANDELNKMWKILDIDNTKTKNIEFSNYSNWFVAHRSIFIENIIKTFKQKLYNNAFKIFKISALSIVGIYGMKKFYKYITQKYSKNKSVAKKNKFNELFLYNLKNSKTKFNNYLINSPYYQTFL